MIFAEELRMKPFTRFTLSVTQELAMPSDTERLVCK